MKIERTTTIAEFIENFEMSIRLKNSLKRIVINNKCRFLTELSVVMLFNIRTFGIKQIRELIELYPNLTNETGIISHEVLKSYKKCLN